ncbi:Uncharacterised protein [uncultured Clostridium sp.]|uniref:hypothetical protein n=1 Tax=uncultured Clostridium sp. TaxID=59620 RepID=UPI000822B93B|nr:hypothetical protein [uncultured Clostridium sp.]SCJ60459.1 Uncharacterised protein [uncultured Clostridium sp.]
MIKINNKRLALSILIISLISVLIIAWYVKIKLSQNDMMLFMVMFNIMILTTFMILTLIIFIIIFLARLVSKKENCFGRALGIVAAITIIMILSTAIMIKEENRYYHTINRNWKINLPREYEEIYYTDSGPSFHGDGERYSIFQYETLKEVDNLLQWQDKNNYADHNIKEILYKLEVPKKYYPDLNGELKYYYITKEDRSKLYIIFNRDLRKIYIIENFL